MSMLKYFFDCKVKDGKELFKGLKIMKEGEKQKIKPKDDEELNKTTPYLKLQMKALVARDLWDMTEYFAIINETNDIVLKALEIL